MLLARGRPRHRIYSMNPSDVRQPARDGGGETRLKTYDIELQRVKAMSNGHGQVLAQVEAVVQPRTARDDAEPVTLLRMDEATARVLLMLLKKELAEFDKRKARSQR